MGFFGDAANRIRAWVRRDKEQAALQFAKGSTASGYPTSGYDLLQAYGYDVLSDYLKLESDLMSRYVDYEEMCEHPLLSTAVEIFADDATQHDNQNGHTVWMSSTDKTIEEIGEDLLHKTLRMDEEIWSIASTMGAYGNDMEEILVNDQGVVGLNYLAPPTVRRIEGPRGELYGFVQDFRGRFGYSPAEYQQIMAARTAMRMGATVAGGTMAGMERVTALEDWEVVHFRIHGRQRRSIYGRSVLESGRFIWKRLVLLEDASIIYRLQRAPERYAFYVDIGDLPPQEALAYLNRVRQQHKKEKYLNPTTGRLDLKHRPMSQMDDFFVPTRQGADGTRIEVLGAPSWQCLAGSTRIPLLDGTSPTIRELSERKEDFWVYSVDKEGRLVPGRAYSARQTRPSAEIFEVGLDDGSVVECTGNHPFLTRDGQWVLAEDLQEGQSLMSLSLYRVRAAVRSVRKTGRSEPVYCMTVADHHNFAVAQGVFVSNSMEDIQYFRDQLFAAIKIPKTYMADDAGGNKGSLSSQDVRFARTVLRMQRELKNGLQKIMRVHLAALNIDPQQVDYTMHMTIPSAIFELAQLEVQNARADLAARMDPFMDKYYLLSKVFKLSDEEIARVMQGRQDDAEREANIMASSQSIMQREVTAAGMQGQAQGQIDMTQMMNAAGMQTPDQAQQSAQAQQQQMAQAQQQQQMAQAQQKPKPGQRESVIGGPLIRVRDGVRPREYYGLERSLFEGSKRGSEKRLDEKMDKLLRSDRMLQENLRQLSGLMKDLADATRGRNR